MAKKGLLLKEEYVKKHEDEVPVDPCKGWIDACEFCDKRFGSWVESSDEVLEKIPSKPGIFMIALKNKSNTEIQNIVLDGSDVQKVAYNCLDLVKDLVADKKSKVTKSTIVCRWMNFKSKSDKDVVTLCAHWYNNGNQPKLMKSWPGADLLEQSDLVTFSNKMKKWCYHRKDAVWRKNKTVPSKTVEVVAECDFENSCEICDSFGFSSWKSLEDVVQDNLVQDVIGIYQISMRYGKHREIVAIGFDSKDIKCNIQLCLKHDIRRMQTLYKNQKFCNKDPHLEVRWLDMQNVDNNNSCFLYAHWLNTDALPITNGHLPGKNMLEKHKNFVFRVNDKRWCYEIEVFKQSRLSKYKSRKQIMDELSEDIRYLHYVED